MKSGKIEGVLSEKISSKPIPAVVDKIPMEQVAYDADNAEVFKRVTANLRKFTVKFNRPLADVSVNELDAALQVMAGDKVLSKSVGEIDFTAISAADKTEIEIEVKADYDGVFTVKTVRPEEIKARGNASIALKSFEVKQKLDMAAPVLESITLSADKSKVTFNFNDALDETSAKAPANYVFKKADGTAGTALTFSKLSDDKKSVEFAITASEVATGATLVAKKEVADANKVPATKDSKVFVLNGKTTPAFVDNGPKVVGVPTAAVTEYKVITINFDQEIKGTPATDWVTEDDGSADVSSVVLGADKKSIVVTLSTELANSKVLTLVAGKVFNNEDTPVVTVKFTYDNSTHAFTATP